jgi:hypothetical protein
MQKWLAVVVFTLAVMVAAMGVKNMTVKASSGDLQPTLMAWGGVPAPPTPYSNVVAHWGGVPAPPTPYSNVAAHWGGVPAPPTPYAK